MAGHVGRLLQALTSSSSASVLTSSAGVSSAAGSMTASGEWHCVHVGHALAGQSGVYWHEVKEVFTVFGLFVIFVFFMDPCSLFFFLLLFLLCALHQTLCGFPFLLFVLSVASFRCFCLFFFWSCQLSWRTWSCSDKGVSDVKLALVAVSNFSAPW